MVLGHFACLNLNVLHTKIKFKLSVNMERSKEISEIINNHWMRLSMIARIIKVKGCYLSKPKVEADNTNRNNSRYHVITKSNNCFIGHFKY